MAFPVARTGLLQIGVPFHDGRVNLGAGGANWVLLFFTSASNFVTPANVYQDAALATPFAPTGQVTADANGLFPKIYVDTSINYGVQFLNNASVVQRQYTQYQGALANTGNDASTGAGQGLNVSAFQEYNLRTIAGGSGAALTIKAQGPAGIPLRLISPAQGTAVLAINNSVTTGAQTATFTATNKPGAGQVTVLLTVAPPPGPGYVGGTLTANWPFATMTATATVTLSTGQVISGATLTNGSAVFTTPSTTITGVPSTAISVSTGIGPVAWLPLSCDGTVYYTPLWRGDDFVPPLIGSGGPQGETINAANVTFNGNGATTVTGAGATAVPSSWFLPQQTGVGAGFWINITKTGGAAGAGFTAAQGAWTNISAGGLLVDETSNATLTGTYQMSSSVTGSPVVASGMITLSGSTNGVQGLAINVGFIDYNTNGTTTTQGGTAPGNWFNPTTANIGNSFWINVAQTGGSGTLKGIALNTWVALSSIQNLYAFSTSVTGNYQIASNSSGTLLMASGTLALGSATPAVQPANFSVGNGLTIVYNTNGTMGGSASGNWYSPTTTNIGNSYWLMVNNVSGGTLTGITAGAWTALSSAITLGNSGNSTLTANWQISTSSGGSPIAAGGTISISGSFTPVTRTYTTGTSVTETAPSGAANVVIEVFGGAGGGGAGTGTKPPNWAGGGGGGSGGYSRTSTSITGGQTLVYSVGAAGAAGAIIGGQGGNGTASSCQSGTKTITTMTGGAGTGGDGGGDGIGGSGGTASGGTAANTSGNRGSDGSNSSAGVGGAGRSGINGNGNAGGNGGFSQSGAGHAGGGGVVVFRYT